MPTNEQRGEPVRIPPATRAIERDEAARGTNLKLREQIERRSIVRGLLLLGLVVLLASMVRAGFGRVFVGTWWRP